MFPRIAGSCTSTSCTLKVPKRRSGRLRKDSSAACSNYVEKAGTSLMRPEMLLYAALVMVASAVLLSFVRVLRGPTLPDRVVALDLIGISSVGLMVLGSAVSGERAFLDAAVVVA